MTAAPPYDLRIEADGTIAIHDWRPELRRQLWRHGLIFVGLAVIVALAIWGGWLGLQDEIAGIRYTPGSRRLRRDFEPSTVVVYAFLIAATCGCYALWRLYRKIVLLRRLLHAPADLTLSPAGLTDRWDGNRLLPWTDIARARLGVQGDAAAIRLDMTNGTGRVLSALYGEAALPLALDTLFVLARHVAVEGLPPDYTPLHPALQHLAPPPPASPPAMPAESVERVNCIGKAISPYAFLVAGILALICGQFAAGTWDAGAGVARLWLAQAGTALFTGLFVFLIGQQLKGAHDFVAYADGIAFHHLAALGHLPWSSVLAVDGRPEREGFVRYDFILPDLKARIAALPWYLRWLYRWRVGATPFIRRMIPASPAVTTRNLLLMRRWRYQAMMAPERSPLQAKSA